MENITIAYPTSGITLLDSTSSMTTKYYDYDKYVKSPLDYITLVVYSLTFLLGTIGNGLVIWFTIFRMKKTVNVIWLLNLSIADFTFSIFLPFSIIYLANDYKWLFGNFMCKLNFMVLFLNLFACVFLLTVISIDRCIAVIFPVWCLNHRTPRLALFVVIGVWILAIVFSLPYFIFQDTLEYNNVVVCLTNFELNQSPDIGRSRQGWTVIIRFIVGFLIPFIIMVTCYTVIALRIRRNPMTTSTKPFKVIIAVIIFFLVCWLPYHIFSFLELYSAYREDEYLSSEIRIGISITASLSFLNSVVNPFLYAFIAQDFRATYWRSIQSVFQKVLI
ncbi:chemerin-like receptor 1 [Rhinoderma darwinii]|uniref:chemerin-like receptor 1 n=1 Tax=Rhinoderma darwinii TaxID=43563 RepID=UPI003F666AA2